jgi:hypothetical protein
MARRLRGKNEAIYDRFLRIGVRFLVAAELAVTDREHRQVVDLTESSLDGSPN